MKPCISKSNLLSVVTLVAVVLLTGVSLERSLAENTSPSPSTRNPIPTDQIGSVAGKQYSGDGLCVFATNGGALLRCVFQRMEGEISRDGLWLKSTVPNQANDRFRVKAVAVGNQSLRDRGDVSVEGGIVRFSRPGLVEEYSVSMDGVRQDFVVVEKLPGQTGLRVQLAVEGATAEKTVAGARLALDKSGRKIAYSRLKVTDANGKELPAHIDVTLNSALRTPHSKLAMVVVVDDADAIYPVQIDPTFSDANWIGLGGMRGVDNTIRAAVADGAGNLYVGGEFAVAGDVIANRVAKWNGSSWSALGSGMNGNVLA